MRLLDSSLLKGIKDLKYIVFDSARTTKPIWIVLLFFVLGGALLYVAWPKGGLVILVATIVFLLLFTIMKTVKEIKYRYEFVRKSKEDENTFLETSLSDPPFRRL